ncbi:MAG: CvpA family protein [Spirochaetes bacterium]|nr:CvpA family protein [Spirochaetota bacterium]MBU0957029.1 CvpA family protein [Spirochaetota bacterium]
MNYLDIIFLVILVITGLRCLIRGLVVEISSKLAIMAAIAAGFLMYKPVGALIASFVALGFLQPILAFLLAGTVAFLLVKLLGKSLQTVIETLNLDFLDSALGLIFGLIEGLAIVLIILAIFHFQPFFDMTGFLSGSLIARILMPLFIKILPVLPAAEEASRLLFFQTTGAA